MSTSIPSRRRRARAYHHGNLRACLVDEAVKAIDAHGVEQFSLREAAARAGVSSSAAYKHFADKAELLAEIARSGFSALAQAVEDAMAAARAQARGRRARAQAAFEAQGIAYVRFAVEHRTRYRVMFGPYGAGSARDVSGRSAEGKTPYELLQASLDELQAVGMLHPSRREEAPRVIWSATHGLADLLISGSLAHPGPAALEGMTVALARVILAGFRSAPAG